MTDQMVTQSDLATLAKKLDDVGDVFSPTETNLLLAIFTLAGEAIRARIRRAPIAGEKESAASQATVARSSILSTGFRGAFQSVAEADMKLRSNLDKAANSVEISIII